MNFKFPPSEVAELKRWMGLNEEVIRHLLVKEDEKEETSVSSSSSPEEEISEEAVSEDAAGDVSSQS